MNLRQSAIVGALCVVAASCGSADVDVSVSEEKLREEISHTCEYNAVYPADAVIYGEGYTINIDEAKKSFTLSGPARLEGTGEYAGVINEPVNITCTGTYEISDDQVSVTASSDYS